MRRTRAGHIHQLGIEGHEKIRSVKAFVITPSVNLSDLAEQHQRDMPPLIQYFVSSLGRDAASCADLMSYLLFTPNHTRDLIEIGYRDASERIEEIEEFLYSSQEGDAENPPASVSAGNVSQAGSAAKRTGNSVRSRG
jgi:NTE family protein